ncbi:asparagine synthase (glutamine-hydrolyzing) [Kiloniella antarctica]|uniref:asparagine synthase (glutamine-hydrolyzing) n=1 Tax=Kiloniella antarctica TaxID=1550907 RepID=A0ABW5BL49_9PROT
MCGIAGFIKTSSARLDTVQILHNLSQSIQHRGPDAAGFGVWGKGKEVEINHQTPANFSTTSPDLAFVHRRLSIIDTSENGNQPIKSADGRYLLIQNGEIYNYIELREELKKLGHNFQTESDTEVLLKSFMQWNCGAFNRFVGMFAIAILDTLKNEIILARDFFGIKPLFYARTSDALVFGSEIKALLTFPGIDNKPNLSTVRDYLSLGLVNHNQESFYASINSIEPGHYLKLKFNNPHDFQIHQYYKRSTTRLTTKDISFQEAADHLRELFIESVKLHMRSDVPYGAALSGGVDSSAIIAAMRSISGKDQDLQTFTYSTKNTTFDEESYADIMIQSASTISHKIVLHHKDLLSDINSVLQTQDEPFGSTSIYAQYKVFQVARKSGIKVILGGQGADEILAGYRSYYTAAVAGMVKSGRLIHAIHLVRALSNQGKISLANFLFRVIARLCPAAVGREIHRRYAENGINSAVNWQWFTDHGVAGGYANLPGTSKSLEEALEGDLSNFNLPGLLRYEDRNSMAHSLESRVPFLTPTIVDFSSSLPPEYLIDRNGCDKAVLRAALRALVPDEILDRKDKIGFQTPETNWFKELSPWINQVLTSDSFQRMPFITTEKAIMNWSLFEQGKIEFPRAIWRWVNLAKWAEMNELKFDE